MAHSGEPVSNAGTLLGNLLEDSGPSVAGDVVVALHFTDVAYTGVAQRSGHDVHRLAGEKRKDVVDRKGQAGFSGLGRDACGMRREHDIGQ